MSLFLGLSRYVSGQEVITLLMDKEISVKRENREAFAAPIPSLNLSKMRFFTGGRHLFRRSWTSAPSSVKSLDGLGPVFNRVSCSGCHVKDGRGKPPEEGSTKFRSMVIKLGLIKNNKLRPDPNYGFQLNDKSILGVPYEGKAKINYDKKIIFYNDGSSISLSIPKYSFQSLSFGPLHKDTKYSGRVAPPVFGLGLIEAISEKDILKKSDPNDKDNDGISGRPHYILDPISNTKKVGKFGWKATRASLLHHITGAAFQDMGLTSNIFPNQNCMTIQKKCIAQISGGEPEISHEQINRLLIYMQTLAPPRQRKPTNKIISNGNSLFHEIGCNKCHTPSYKTNLHENHSELNYKIIKPYSDFLLHDMGPDLDDSLKEGQALSSEWKTPPLWGIGLIKKVNKHTRFLHDGRARSIEEAIIWHGGEAEKAKNNYLNLNKKERNYLLKFLNSL
tara:strand:- start:4870 stop:6213 length:1344 start_codon:yes stop_codon:yes gene_type:complete